ncbi:MAG: TM0106 family RecB-like putative nuclease [Mycobacterium sp.]|nr:TM0106 family RecB-like putative nuclease [Mycobacterium sp.]
MRTQVDDGEIAEPDPVFGSFARLLQRKGEIHEERCLEDYEQNGRSVYRVPERALRESFSSWVERVGNPLAGHWDVIYQMPFVHDGVRGIADFLERKTLPDGRVAYEPADAKLTRVDAKPGHVLQLCFYADAIKALTGQDPSHMHILLGSGRRETLRINDFRPYWRRLRGQLRVAIEAGPTSSTKPEKCNHCQFCEFYATCESHWRAEDSLVFIPGIRLTERASLDAAGIFRVAQLSECDRELSGIRQPRLNWLVRQAALQVEARLAGDSRLPYAMIEPGEDARLGRGFELLPPPDAGDIFLDFEGHPFWQPDAGLFFLFGLIERNESDAWEYRSWWAHDPHQETDAVLNLIAHIIERRERFPAMHVYHYNHTERTALQSLTRRRGAGEADLGKLIQAEVFVDLFDVARNSLQVGSESYSLKCLEKLTGYQRTHDIDKGAGAVVSYEKYMSDGDQAALEAIAKYNEDDVRATLALRDWLVGERPADLPWRQPPAAPSEVLVDIDDQIAAFHSFGEGTPEHLLGDLLGYWTNEWWAYLMPKLAQCQQDTTDLLESRDAIAALTPVGRFPRMGKKGKELKNPAMRFSFPRQLLDAFPGGDENVLYTLPDGTWISAKIDRLDRDGNEVDLEWSERNEEAAHLPASVILHSWVPTEKKRLALFDFAARLLDDNAPNRVTDELLRRRLPVFRTGQVLPGGVFADDLDQMLRWATQLDHSFVAVQGPPGTGKTYRAAHIIHALVLSGQRVGITAFSHRAIENVIRKTIEIFKEKGDFELIKGVRNKQGATRKLDGFANGGADIAVRPGVNIVAGTAWMFSNEKMREAPVDVLLIDEAGQLALADALAASTSARNLILLGDPLQLPQVTQAVHPGGGGRSVLEHILGEDVTLSSDRGVFIKQTRRMHPDICRFISDEIYEGRLTWHDSCAVQKTVAGTGLRWLRATHHGNSTSSVEEAEMVVKQIIELIGTPWRNADGVQAPLTVDDFIVVAPYNDQVRTIRGALNADPRTRGVAVETVDKFQGGEAAVVLFSMATSTGSDMVRGADFLFSRNRLNVAISRARCLAYLICTEELLNTRAKSVVEMRLIATLNSFVEYTEGHNGTLTAIEGEGK